MITSLIHTVQYFSIPLYMAHLVKQTDIERHGSFSVSDHEHVLVTAGTGVLGWCTLYALFCVSKRSPGGCFFTHTILIIQRWLVEGIGWLGGSGAIGTNICLLVLWHMWTTLLSWLPGGWC